MTDPRLSIKSPPMLKDMNERLMAERPDELSVLTVPGRRSGAPRRTPLTVYERAGHRYVLGGFPGADWIANVRAAGRGTLTAGGTTEPVRLVETDPAEAVTVLRDWPTVAPRGVDLMIAAGVVTDPTPDALAAAVGICPVFRVERENG